MLIKDSRQRQPQRAAGLGAAALCLMALMQVQTSSMEVRASGPTPKATATTSSTPKGSYASLTAKFSNNDGEKPTGGAKESSPPARPRGNPNTPDDSADPPCDRLVGQNTFCIANPADPANPLTRLPTRDEAQAWAASVALRIEIPRPAISVGPDPSANEWNMAVVGLPVWFWSTESTTVTRTIRAYGYDFTLRARRAHVDFNFGDGRSMRCTSMTRYPGGESALGKPSPDCGHTYSRPSLPSGAYTVTASATWVIDWEAANYSGTLPMQLNQSQQLRVGELQAVTVRNP